MIGGIDREMTNAANDQAPAEDASVAYIEGVVSRNKIDAAQAAARS